MAMLEPADICQSHLCRFYAALAELEARLGGWLHLETSSRGDIRADRGVYFFFEPGEVRGGPRSRLRVVRVGTHGLGAGARSSLWSRLRQHRGIAAGGGNQRGSVFRRHIGGALMEAGLLAPVQGWESGSNAAPAQRMAESDAEREVSRVIRHMPFLHLPVGDAAGPDSARGYVERNAIALLSSPMACALDPPSPGWLGWHARAPEIRRSGLWNVRHVGEPMDAAFPDRFLRLVRGAW